MQSLKPQQHEQSCFQGSIAYIGIDYHKNVLLGAILDQQGPKTTCTSTSCRLSCLLPRSAEAGASAAGSDVGLAPRTGSTSEASSAARCISLPLLPPSEAAAAGGGTGADLRRFLPCLLRRFTSAAALLPGALLPGACAGAAPASDAGLAAAVPGSESEPAALLCAGLSPAQQGERSGALSGQGTTDQQCAP